MAVRVSLAMARICETSCVEPGRSTSGDLPCQIRRDGVAYLCVLRSPVAEKNVRIRKGLEPRRLAYRQASALHRARMNESMTVLGNMACNGHRMKLSDLNAKPVLEYGFGDILRINVLVLREQASREILQPRTCVGFFAERCRKALVPGLCVRRRAGYRPRARDRRRRSARGCSRASRAAPLPAARRPRVRLAPTRPACSCRRSPCG